MNLLLLTKFYPYGTGESFVESEIKILAKYYEKIMIIACEVTDRDISIRPLPKNILIHKVPCALKKKDIIKGMLKCFAKNKVFLEERKKAKYNLFKRMFLNYFEAKSQRVFRYIAENKYLDEFCKEPFVLYSYWFFMTARVGTMIMEKYKPVYSYTRAHRYDLYEEENCIKYLPYRQLFLKKYNNIFTCSNDGAKYLKSYYPALADKVLTAYLGTADYGIGIENSNEVFRIVSCSRIEPVKRINRIIEALQQLENKGIQIEWIHIGDGSQFNKVKKIANDRLRKTRYIFTGNMKNKDIMKFYHETPIDLFINVSSSEGLPVSIMEVISFGIPVIATDVGGTSEIVIDGITGKLISKKFTVTELSDTIQDFMMKGNISVSRNSCRKFWEKYFQADYNYCKMCNFIKMQYKKIN